jgi:magnesium transporter
MNSDSSYQKRVIDFVSKDFTTLNSQYTIEEALVQIREKGLGERIIYFYVIDNEQKLVGVLPTRRLLMGKLDQRLEDIMVPHVAALPESASIYDALEFFATYRFLAFPVVDEDRKIIGVVDVNFFTEKLLNTDEPEEVNDVFEELGFKISEIKNASPTKAWKFRFPWLLATITSGTTCAVFAGLFKATMAANVILASFLALVLGLAESMSIQSMTVTIQILHANKPSGKWYIKNLFRELTTGLLIGVSCGLIVALLVLAWKHTLVHAAIIGGSIILTQLIATINGLSIPSALHALKLDPKIAAGPITLGLTDIFSILIYLGAASLVL